jgi:hypothetical protein
MTPHLSHLKVPLAKFTIIVERSNEGEEREKDHLGVQEVELLWERASCSHKAHT